MDVYYECVVAMDAWAKAHKENIIVVHCAAGRSVPNPVIFIEIAEAGQAR